MNIFVELGQNVILPVINNLEIIEGNGPIIVALEEPNGNITVRKVHRIFTTK